MSIDPNDTFDFDAAWHETYLEIISVDIESALKRCAEDEAFQECFKALRVCGDGDYFGLRMRRKVLIDSFERVTENYAKDLLLRRNPLLLNEQEENMPKLSGLLKEQAS